MLNFGLSLFLIFYISLAKANSITSSSVYQKESSIFKEILDKSSISYFMNFAGPTLKGRKGDETYSKFQTGFNRQGQELDGNQSINAFHVLALNYQYNLNTSFSLSYAYDTFHGDDVTFKWPDGSTGTRTTNGSQYDPRVTVFFSNIYQSEVLSFSSGIGFEIPMIESSIANKLNTTLVLTPSLAFKKVPRNFFLGVSALIEKYFYDDQRIVNENYIKTTSIILAPYLNYQLTNKLQFKTRVEFDWDQRAEQTGTTEFGNNMVNSYRVGLGYTYSTNLTFGSHLEAIIGDTKLETTSIGAFIGLRI